MSESKGFFRVLALVLGLTAVVWIGYGLAQPRYDPNSAQPAFDAAYYVDWSDALLKADETDPRFSGASAWRRRSS